VLRRLDEHLWERRPPLRNGSPAQSCDASVTIRPGNANIVVFARMLAITWGAKMRSG